MSLENYKEQIKLTSKLAYFLILILLSSLVLGSFLRIGIDGHPYATFADTFSENLHKPFVYRFLPRIAISSLLYIVPQSVKEKIDNFIKQNAYLSYDKINIRRLFNYFGWQQSRPADYVLTSGFLLVCLWGFAFALRFFIHSQYATSIKIKMVLSLVALAGLPCMFDYHSYLYDLPHLIIFTLCLAFLSNGKWMLYCCMLVLSTLTKETSILLIMIFVIQYRKTLQRKLFFQLLSLQLSIYGVLIFILRYSFRFSPGPSLELHLQHNLTLMPYGIGNFMGLALLSVAVICNWSEKPIFLKNSIPILAPLFILTFFFGFIDEYRDYYEVYPIIFLLAGDTVLRVLQVKNFAPRKITAD